MVQARNQMRPAPAMPAHDDGVATSLQATASPKVAVYAGGAVAEVPVTPIRFKRIVNQKRGLSKVISGYADAAAKASQTGKIFVMPFQIPRRLDALCWPHRPDSDGASETVKSRQRRALAARGNPW